MFSRDSWSSFEQLVKKSAIVFLGKDFDWVGAFYSREEIITRACFNTNFPDRLCCHRLSYDRVDRRLIKQLQSSIECSVKRLFLAHNCLFDCFLFRADFGKNVAHRLCHDVDKFGEERSVKTKCAAVANRAAQDTTQNITAAFV